MSRKRKILVGVLAVIVGFAGWFYYYMFMSPDAAIRHAEAFLFRRMKVAQLGEQGVFRFFFATNRKTENDGGPLEESFGKEREPVLKFGSFDAEIQSSLGLPDSALSYLVSHGSLDQERMKFYCKLANRIIDKADQEAIIQVARNTFRLFADVLRSIPHHQEIKDAA